MQELGYCYQLFIIDKVILDYICLDILTLFVRVCVSFLIFLDIDLSTWLSYFECSVEHYLLNNRYEHYYLIIVDIYVRLLLILQNN